jgi:YHS domain-containing protein
MCGKEVEAKGSESSEYKGRTYYFCSVECQAHFEREAARLHLFDLVRMGALFCMDGVPWGLA